MTEAGSGAHSPEEPELERLVRRYADDPLNNRLLMRLYGARSGQTLSDLAEPLRVHPSRARKSLRMLVSDGLVKEQGTGRAATYSLSNSPSARTLVTQLLQRNIEPGGIDSSREHNG